MIAEDTWRSLLSWYDTAPEFQRRAILRSLFLRALESSRGLPASRRAAAGAIRRLLGSVLSRRREILRPADIWIVAEASTPSHLGTALSLVDLCRHAQIQALLLTPNEHVRRRRLGRTDFASTSLERLAGHLGIWRRLGVACRASISIYRELAHTRQRLTLLARVQLASEAGLAAVAHEAFVNALRLHRPTVMIGPSEYFALGAAACEAASSAGLPWITVQHGAINLTYAPSFASEYWVWGVEAAHALQSLAGEDTPLIRTLGALRIDESNDPHAGLPTSALDKQRRPKTITLFTQSHGLEYEPGYHEALAAELLSVLDHIADAHLLVKTHPSEKTSVYRDRLEGHPRVNVVDDPAATAASIARASVCCLAIDSTALLEAMAVGSLAVAVDGGSGSVVAQPVAAHVSDLGSLADFLARVLRSEREMGAALRYQTQRLPALLANVGEVRAAHEEALKDLVTVMRGQA